ncbi:hypothetical protein BGZ94_002564 [Podila epigama]|nr:hypothetical protein BGZ94_002564 [Podila epigama]
MYHNRQDWDNSSARSPFDDSHQQTSQQHPSPSFSQDYASSQSQQQQQQQQQQQHHSHNSNYHNTNNSNNSNNNNFHTDDDNEPGEVYPVGRPLSYFPTHHQPLHQHEYDDEAQRLSQYHHMPPLEHAQSPLSSRSAEWSGGGYSGYQHPSTDIPMVGIDIISSNLNTKNNTQFSDTRTAENMADVLPRPEFHQSGSTAAAAGVGNHSSQPYHGNHGGYTPYDNTHSGPPPHSPHSYPQQPYPPSHNQVQPMDGSASNMEEGGEAVPKALLDPKVQKQLSKRKVYKPWFVWLVSAIQIAVLVYEFVKNYERTQQVIQTSPFNPMIGPGTGTIIAMGARFVPCMRSTYLDNEQIKCPDNQTQICTISDICGFTPNNTTGAPPNQWFRFITPIFLHGGVIHLLFNMMFQMRTGADLERDMGWWRFGIIYMTSGILGFVFGGNFAPLLSPHIGGFIGGILTGLVFMPVVYFSKRDKVIKLGLRCVALPLIVLVLALGITNFYKGDNTCTWCKYLRYCTNRQDQNRSKWTINPVIPSWLAGISCVLFTVMFVGSLYVIPRGRVPEDKPAWHNLRMDRDHPLVIQQRFKGILLTSVLSTIFLWFVFAYTGAIPIDLPLGVKVKTFLALLGLSLPEQQFKLVFQVVVPLALVAILFVGPLLMMYLNRELPFQSRFNWAENKQHFFYEWVGIRNYIVGPIAEEFIFRACMVSITVFTGASVKAMVFGLPLVFGIDVGAMGHYGQWKKWLYLALVGGMVGFGVLLGPMTRPDLYGDPHTSAYWAVTMRQTVG